MEGDSAVQAVYGRRNRCLCQFAVAVLKLVQIVSIKTPDGAERSFSVFAGPGMWKGVTDDDEGGEGETTSTLHDLGDAVDGDDARLAQSTWFTCDGCVCCDVAHQNSRPASRAASATAATRPW